GLDALREGSIDQVLALDGEEPELLTVLPRREKLPDQPELLGLGGGDQAGVGASSPSASLARSATRANACGSETAISASDLRSSSIPAFRTPAMKRLYERPFARAAALMRTIQSDRKVRFFPLRSRWGGGG